MYSNTDYEAERNKRAAEQAKFRKLIIGGGIAVAAIIAGLITFFNSYSVITPGHGGVQYSLSGGVKQEVLGQGWNWHWPVVNVTQYPTSTEIEKRLIIRKEDGSVKSDDSIQVNTGDGKSVRMAFTYNYSMKPDMLPHIFTKFRRQSGPQIADNYIDQQIINIMQQLGTKHSVLEVYSQKRGEINQKAFEELRDDLGKDGIILEEFTIVDIVPDTATLQVLQQIADEQNKSELVIRQRNTLAQEEQNIAQQNKNNLASANGAKAVAEVKAQENAQVSFIEAEGQAKANRELASSITPALLQLKQLEVAPLIKYPLVLGDGGGANILNFPSEFLNPQK